MKKLVHIPIVFYLSRAHPELVEGLSALEDILRQAQDERKTLNSMK